MKIKLSHRVFSAGCMLLLTAAFAGVGCVQTDNTTAVSPEFPKIAQGDPYIVYQRSSGLNDMRDTLSIYSGGDCELVGKNGDLHSCRVLPLKLGKIEQAFQEAGFFALPEEYPGNSQADAIKYCIDYSAEGKNHRVTAYSNAMPDPLIPLDQGTRPVRHAGLDSRRQVAALSNTETMRSAVWPSHNGMEDLDLDLD